MTQQNSDGLKASLSAQGLVSSLAAAAACNGIFIFIFIFLAPVLSGHLSRARSAQKDVKHGS